MPLRLTVPRRWLALALTALTLLTVPGPAIQAAESCSDPSAFEFVPAQGPSCRVHGGWILLLADGTRLFTHGPDAHAPAVAGLAGGADTSGGARAPVCVSDPGSEYHNHVIYARPENGTDDSATRIPEIRGWVLQANGRIFNESSKFGYTSDFRMRCAADGTVEITHVTVPIDTGGTYYSRLVDELRGLGYDSTYAKYWVVYQESNPEAAGEATVDADSSPGEENANNFGPGYAVTWGRAGVGTFLHEAAHELGAVQTDAPYATGGHHCRDDEDVMCYADGSWGSDKRVDACRNRGNFDCRHDTYFHPHPPSDAWLATHWNLASSVNHFIRTVPGNPFPARPVDVSVEPGPGVGEVTVTWAPPAHSGDSAITEYHVYSQIRRDARTLSRGAQVDAGTFGATLGGFPDASEIVVWVAAVNTAGEGGWSAEDRARTFSVPGRPDAPVALATGVGEATVTWTAPHDGGTPITHYVLRRAPYSTYDWTTIVTENASTTYVDEGLATGTYKYTVRAVNAVGEGSNSPDSLAVAVP